MPYGMYISADGAAAQAQRLEVIANNLANVDTAGFKQDVATFQSRLSEAIQQGHATAGDQSTGNVGGGVKLQDVITDFSTGQIQSTDNPLDMAIIGDGFFHVEGNDGQMHLSRAGNFTLDPNGRLVTQAGQHPVLDQAGAPITLASNLPWEVSDDGFLSQGGAIRALGLSKPESLGDLVKAGQNMFRSLGPISPVPFNERQVRQGFLEKSAANPISQMMAMIETTRAFEANTKMIQSQDSMLGTLIGRVLRA